MNQLISVNKSNVEVPLNWELLYGEKVSETEFLRDIRRLPLDQMLPRLVGLLQFGDTGGRPAYRILDNLVDDIFNTVRAGRIADWLSQGKSWIFFSQWQLLFAIKLICAFGSRDAGEVEVTDGQLIKLLLMTNGIYPKGISDVATIEDAVEGLKSTALKGYSLPSREHPWMLIGRYSELLGRLAMLVNREDFKNWVDIQKVIEDGIGARLETFKAVLFALHGSTIDESSELDSGWSFPQIGRINPDEFFGSTLLPKEEVDRVLELVSTSPDKIREEHQRKHGNRIGNPNDLRILLRYPSLTLSDGSIIAISSQLLIQRYTNGLYWDINDALPNDKNTEPNRGKFQTFFGELHERYGCDTLQRIKDGQARRRKKVCLLLENDYKSGDGSNPDSLLIERIGNHNTRCTLFEFKVGRPRYMDSIVAGDVQAFEEDLRRKIGSGLDQEMNFYQQVQSSERGIPGLVAGDITAWFFVIVVTDPFPSIGMFLEELRRKVDNLPDLGKTKRYGPIVLSLSELEQLETLAKDCKDRISEWLIRFWNDGSDIEWTFNNFYIRRTGGAVTNSYVERLADDDMKQFLTPIFGVEPPELAEC